MQKGLQKAIIRIAMSNETEDKFFSEQLRMLKYDITGRGITDPRIVNVFSQIRREEFVPEAYQSQAYSDGPLPIGLGQTISQPYIVALMTQKLQVDEKCEILEIGTGSGYQTAILAKLAKRVYTIDRFNELSESAQAVLGRLDITNVEFYIGDGSCGWPGKKHFDRIIITATVPTIPEPLIKQLKEGGLIVGPVGSGWAQQLVTCEKKKGKITQKAFCEVRFVKLIGEYGFKE